MEFIAFLFSTVIGLEILYGIKEVKASSLGITALVLCWFALLCRSTWISVDYSTSFPALIKVASLVLLFFNCSRIANRKEFIMSTLSAATVTGFIHGFMAIQEYIEAPPIPATWIDPALKAYVRTRCAGIFTDPNIFGAFLAVIFILISTRLLLAQSFKDKATAFSAMLICGFGELTTLSRGSWIAMATGIIFMLIFHAKRRSKNLDQKLFVAAILILAAIIVTGPFKYRIFSIVKSKDMTIAQRTLINKGVAANFRHFPLTGKGLHTFNQVYPGFRIVGGDYPMNAHNELIHSLVESGHLSAIMLLLLACLILYKSFVTDDEMNVFRAGFAGAFFCLIVHNMSGFSSRILPTSALISLSAAGAAFCRISADFETNIRKDIARIFGIFIIGAAIFVLYEAEKCYRINSLMLKGYEEMSKTETLDQAIETFSLVERLDPANAIAAANKAEIFYARGKFAEAVSAINDALQRNPSEALYHLKLAHLLEEKNGKRADECYKEAIRLDPASELIRLEYANFLIKTGNKSEALAQLNQALKFSPGFHNVYTNYMEIEELKNQLEQELDQASN
ncbi:MAG: hypothetical protein Kow0029_27170 [Candidatus Rifleibacteriota bacterium]